MKILVLGGTRYFGRHLILDLLEKGHSVIVATRGNLDFPFKDEVNFFKADRKSLDDLKSLASLGPFDIIYDQICMNVLDAENAIRAFKGHCSRYIFTSTGSVYDFKNDHVLVETDFDYTHYPVNHTPTAPANYQEDKRQAEVAFSSQNYFPVAMVRLPIVLGIDDYTERLKFHVQKIKNEEEIFIPRLETRMSFVDSNEAGRFLSFVGMETRFEGAINCASNGAIALKDLIREIEETTGKKFKRAATATPTNQSPFGSEVDFMMSNARATELGFTFENLNDYLPSLIKQFSKL
jgi:nucleoside-diphosphate-sugar epimerase